MTKLVSQATCDRVRLLCGVHPERVVAELTGVSRNTIYFLRKRGWKAASRFRRMRSRPTDFAIQRRYMNREQLASHYGTANRSIARWHGELDNR